jgi:chromate transporter
MTTTSPSPNFAELVRVSARIGCLSFGGPAGQIALMHRELVEERGWISEEQYLHALNFCHLLPGPEAQQLAIWIGWKLHGIRGGLAAGLLFVIPGAAIILALSILYGAAAHLAWFAALFLGSRQRCWPSSCRRCCVWRAARWGRRFAKARPLSRFWRCLCSMRPFRWW